MSEKPEETSKRKRDHLKICLADDVQYRTKTTGFEQYDFVHFAATEVDINQIDLSMKLFGKKINYPFLISSMTGGTREAGKINKQLANVAQELGIALGVGSQRQALNDDSYLDTYKMMRDIAPDIPLFGNIGAYQVAKAKDPVELAEKLVKMIDADALIIHLNPLQELMQVEGETDFTGLLKNLNVIARTCKFPVIAKEVGAGIGKQAAKRLLESGIKAIDVAGAGGTSWAAVELRRSRIEDDYFHEWGIPTAECLSDVQKLKKKFDFVLISSGGIDDGVKVAKSFALGGDIVASANPLLKVLFDSGSEKLMDTIHSWFGVVKKIMYLTGSKSLNELRNKKLIRRPY